MFSAVQFDVSDPDWDSIAESYAELWPLICDAANAYLSEYPTRADRANRLRIHVRPDSGTLYFAFTGPKPFYGEVASIVCPFLERSYYELPNDDTFDAAHDELLACVFRTLSSSAMDESARNAIDSLCRDHEITVSVLQYDDDETERELLASA